MAIIWLLIFFGIIFGVYTYATRRTKIKVALPVQEITHLLETEVDFYQKIASVSKKENFKQRIIQFMQHVKFTSVGEDTHTLLDEVLIASSAIIPIFHFPNWEYTNINEVLLYADNFDHDYAVGEEHSIMGMVGEGALQHTMLLSLKALREGFDKKEGSQTALHEFVHLIDKSDGSVDGIPEYLIPAELIKPWLRLMRVMIQEIRSDDTEINPYAGTNEAEFFAVISEYFFEKPGMLQRQHPALYSLLCKIFEPKNPIASDSI